MKSTGKLDKKSLACELGISVRQLSRHLGHSSWRWSRAGPWKLGDVERMRAWREDHVSLANRPSGDDDGNLSEDRRRWWRARAEERERLNAVASGALLPRAEVEAGLVARAHAIRFGLMGLADELCPLVGEHHRALLETSFAGLLNRWADSARVLPEQSEQP